jgi:histone H3/H4
VKGWFFWNWLGNTCGGELPLFNPTEYKDIESAHDAIKDQERMRLSRQIKKIEIIDNKVNTGKDEMLISSDAIDRADEIVKKFSDYIYNTAFKLVKDEQRKRVEVADIDRVSLRGEYIGWGSGSCQPMITCQENSYQENSYQENLSQGNTND